MFKWFKKKNNEQQEEQSIQTENKEMALLLLTDKQVPNLRAYMHSKGIKVDEIYNNVNDAKIGMFMQSGYCRLVIMETGLGKFTTTIMRAEISDLLGICDGIEKKISVFYTDSIIKSENTDGRRNKDVDWYKFTTTSDVLKKIQSYNETYITDKELVEETLESVDEVMSHKGTEVELKNADKELTIEGSDTEGKIIELIREGLNKEEDSLKTYEVSY